MGTGCPPSQPTRDLGERHELSQRGSGQIHHTIDAQATGLRCAFTESGLWTAQPVFCYSVLFVHFVRYPFNSIRVDELSGFLQVFGSTLITL